MRITKFEAENFKRLKVVRIDPDENTVVIGGRNAQGKSSVLDAIMATLAGRAGAKELVRPIRDGEKKATVVVELDDLRVERKWTPSGSSVTVGPKDGAAKLNSPQAVLDKLIGALAFDPLAFAESEPKKQVETLIDLIGREAFDELAEERKAAYDERTVTNRQVKTFRAQIDALPNVTQHGERVDVAELMVEIRHANDRANLTRRWEELTAEINRLALLRVEVEKEGLQIPKTRGLEELQAELEQADSINKACDVDDRREELTTLLREEEVAVETLNQRIMAADKRKAELIAAAALPVEGLAFDEDGVTYNGVPFQQSSAAERLKVSVAMAMAMNPELRVICIRDASLLDDDSKRALVEMAEEHDYQIWYEVVGDPGEIGVVLEDGEVKA